jgi:hypothetical protein
LKSVSSIFPSAGVTEKEPAVGPLCVERVTV